MSEIKVDFPVYVRVGICKECGAAVYAAEPPGAAGEFKRMSACACVRAAGTTATRRREPVEGKEAA